MTDAAAKFHSIFAPLLNRILIAVWRFQLLRRPLMEEKLLGIPKEEIDTPALLLDLDVLEANIKRIADFFALLPTHLRPHIKTHKCPRIAKMQIASGAKGITCATLAEAEVMAASGIKDILIANQIVGEKKIHRLVQLARTAQPIVAVDNGENVSCLSKEANRFGVEIGSLVEVDVGMGRCGVEPEVATALAERIADSPGLKFSGLMGYEGHTVFIEDFAERKAAAEAAMRLLSKAKQEVEKAGLEVEIVSAGGIGTYSITGKFPGVTEVQAGSYATMDAKYKKIVPEFDCALTLLATVISRPRPNVAITDCGMKAITHEFGLPEILALPGAKVVKLSEEHGKLELSSKARSLKVGQKISLLPTHGCTTINLHHQFHCLRQGKVESIWPIAARARFR